MLTRVLPHAYSGEFFINSIEKICFNQNLFVVCTMELLNGSLFRSAVYLSHNFMSVVLHKS